MILTPWLKIRLAMKIPSKWKLVESGGLSWSFRPMRIIQRTEIWASLLQIPFKMVVSRGFALRTTSHCDRKGPPGSRSIRHPCRPQPWRQMHIARGDHAFSARWGFFFQIVFNQSCRGCFRSRSTQVVWVCSAGEGCWSRDTYIRPMMTNVSNKPNLQAAWTKYPCPVSALRLGWGNGCQWELES